MHSDSSLIVMLQPKVQPSRPSVHFGEEVLGRDYDLLWFLFQGQSYDLARFYRPDGTMTGYYADILEPVHWDNGDPRSLRPITDLFLDLWIHHDGRHLVLDEDELSEALATGAVGQQQFDRAHAVLSELLDQVERGQFPPDRVLNYPWP